MNKNAVISVNNNQFLVSVGDKVEIDGGEIRELSVLAFWEDESDALIGMPKLEGHGVEVKMVNTYKSKKVKVRRFKSKSRYRKNKGHRQTRTVYEVVDFGKGVAAGVGEESKIASKTEKNTNSIEESDLSQRTKRALIEAGYSDLDQVANLSDSEITAIKGLGKKSLDEIRKVS